MLRPQPLVLPGFLLSGEFEPPARKGSLLAFHEKRRCRCCRCCQPSPSVTRGGLVRGRPALPALLTLAALRPPRKACSASADRSLSSTRRGRVDLPACVAEGENVLGSSCGGRRGGPCGRQCRERPGPRRAHALPRAGMLYAPRFPSTARVIRALGSVGARTPVTAQ